jgi:excinuclease ABC subunit C
MAPCMGYISKEDYRKQIDEIISILEGKTDNLKKELEKEMLEASKKMEYEKAQEIRDKIFAIDRISQRQKVSNISENDIDVIGLARKDEEVCIEMFYVRNSKMIVIYRTRLIFCLHFSRKMRTAGCGPSFIYRKDI